MAPKYYQVEEEIDEAIGFQRDQTEPLKITHLASLFNVPYGRLRRRLQGNDSRTTRAPTNRRLDKEQEAALVTYLERCEQGDHQTNKQDFGECLSAYLSLSVLFVCLRNGNDLFVCLYRLPRHYPVLAFE